MVYWIVEFTPSSRKEFDSLDSTIKKRISRYLADRVLPDPKRFGEPLTGDKKGLWRYRVGKFRLIVRIEEGRLVIVVVRVAKRSDVYE